MEPRFGVSISQQRSDPTYGLINWRLVKENLYPEQIEECFDIRGIARGVSREDLRKYVRMDKLHLYFSESQLSDILDLDFFEDKISDPSQIQSAATVAPHAIEISPAENSPHPISKESGASDAVSAFSTKQLLQGILFWQVMETCPGLRYYRRMRQGAYATPSRSV